MLNSNASPLFRELGYYGKKIVYHRLAVGPGGNISARNGNTMWISPSGFGLDEISENQWVPVNIETGQPNHSSLRPSSEILMHLYIYRHRPDVEAVVHTHPPVTIAVISSGHDHIPFMFPDHVAIAGHMSSIDYVIPCTEELATAVVSAITPESTGLLLKNHGLITLGSSLKQAYYRTEIIEDSARVYWMASCMGTPRILTPAETNDILNLEAEKYRQKLLDHSTVEMETSG